MHLGDVILGPSNGVTLSHYSTDLQGVVTCQDMLRCASRDREGEEEDAN